MIKNFVKILELLGDRLEVCVSVCGQKSISFCQIYFSRNKGVPEYDRKVVFREK